MTDRPPTLYIAGPMTGLPELNFPAFHRAERALLARGYEVLNPARHGHGEPGMEWEDYMRRDIADLLQAEGVALLPNHGASKGATIEVGLAEDLKMPVRFLHEWVSMRASTGRGLIRAERQRQIMELGYTVELDNLTYESPNQLVRAAICYEACPPSTQSEPAPAPKSWPWSALVWRPKDPVSNLVRAGALYMAAIESGGLEDIGDTGMVEASLARCGELLDAMVERLGEPR